VGEPGNSGVAAGLGEAIRRTRRSRKLSLRAVAKRAGVTAGLVSQIENGRVTPSVETLFALAAALDVPVAHFFDSSNASSDSASDFAGWSDRRIIRKENRKRLYLETGIIWELLTGEEQPGTRFVEITYPPGARSANMMIRHTGRDFLVVIEGEITVQLEFKDHVLKAGDSMWFDAPVPHQVRNESGAPARLIALTIDPWPATDLNPPDSPHPPPERAP